MRAWMIAAVAGASLAVIAAAPHPGPGQREPAPEEPSRADAGDADGRRVDQQTGEQTPPEPARLRERLERYETALQDRLERTRTLIRRLDAGESPEAVLEELREKWLDGGSLTLLSFPRDQHRNEQNGRDWRGERRQRRGGASGPDGADRSLAPSPAPPPTPPTPEELAELRLFIGEHLPRLDERVHELESRNPEAADRMLRRLAPRLRDIRDLSREDPELAELRLRQMQGAMRLAELGSMLRDRAESGLTRAEIEPLRAEVRELLAAQFDERVRAQEEELAILAERVQRERTELNSQLDRRDEIIDRHVQQIMDRALRGLPAGEAEEPVEEPAEKDGAA